jgi:hypothetical protein
LQEYLADTLDPLSVEERGWMDALVQSGGDVADMAKRAGLTPRAAQAILSRPRIRRALGSVLTHQASPEVIVAGVVDYAMGDVKVSECWEDGTPRRYEHKLKLDALTLLAKMRGLLVDRLDVKGLQDSEASLDRLLAAELDRVRGRIPGASDVIDAEAVTQADRPDVLPDTDPAGEEPNIPPSD